ncbi:MAG TPA: Hsp20/alpha crystallin family protein [Eoetvoesiella sp.]|uniref:Hsp20/alpha crystallin family protein n=1 Tax=Eoetvoesiella sp. TaxID=1966355 RepID=UPI002C0616FF|nr:Hsp20/alpha crystallin family protein [Eoetvoesiella sp.]HWK61575.1 Hsp20/alpha crystallin family protein [Eoetvoesiella sp.]
MSVRNLVPWTSRRSPASAPQNSTEHPFFSLQRDVNRLFDDMFKGFDIGFPSESLAGTFSGSWPRVEVLDGDQAVHVAAELPGMEEKDIEILLEDDVLTLRGEKRSQNEDAARQFSERFYGKFERRIRLGYDIDEDKIQANFKNGVLNIVLPKDQAAQSRVKHIALNQ